MSTHNVCFHAEMRKNYQQFLVEKKRASSGAMDYTMFELLRYLSNKVKFNLYEAQFSASYCAHAFFGN